MIFVAGGCGFVGRSLCQTLTELGIETICLDIKHNDGSKVTCLEVDITDRSSLERVFNEYHPDVIVNLAAVLFSAAIDNPSHAFLVNVLGSFNLLDLCRIQGVRRFIFGSSYAAIGDQPGLTEPFHEVMHPQPSDYYGETKCFVEELGAAFLDRYDLEFIAARIPLVVGPGKATSTSAWRAEIFNKLNAGGEVRIGYAAEEILPLAHHSDVADSLVALIRAKRLDHSIYHLPSEKWRVSDLGKMIEDVNPGLKITYGDRRITGAPQTVSWERFRREFGLEAPNLRARLLQHRE